MTLPRSLPIALVIAITGSAATPLRADVEKVKNAATVLDERGIDRLLSSKFTVGADATMMAEMLAWSRSRGVFAGISLQGSTLREDTGENKELYGKETPNREIVTGKIAAPASADGLLRALAKFQS